MYVFFFVKKKTAQTNENNFVFVLFCLFVCFVLVSNLWRRRQLIQLAQTLNICFALKLKKKRFIATKKKQTNKQQQQQQQQQQHLNMMRYCTYQWRAVSLLSTL